MTGSVTIQNTSRPLETSLQVKNCTNFWSNFRGLMLQQSIAVNGGALLVEHKDTIINSTIHMLFMNFDITAVWINQAKTVVDVRIAKRWRLAYTPAQPASYVLETHVSQAANFHIGDKVEFIVD